jgi:acyl-CoA dehydrogenase
MTESLNTGNALFASLATDIDFTMPSSAGFPFALWKTLAERGLLSNYSSSKTSSDKMNYANLASAGLALTKLSGYPGLTMTWLGQLLKVDFINRYSKQSKDCIKAVLQGDALCSLAISEPGAGAHPKYLSCSAERQGDYFVLNGEKAYVSHGPYAQWFIVLAITDVLAGKKQFSAFLIHHTQNGLTVGVEEQGSLLAPSSHCNVTFEQCKLPASALIGVPGRAFETISRPMRTLEDVLMLAPIIGAIQVQLDLISASGRNGLDRDILGRCLCLAESALELALLSAQKLDESAELPDLTTLIVGTRTLISEIQSHIEPWLDVHPRIETLYNDIQLLSNIGQSATQARVDSLAEHYLSSDFSNEKVLRKGLFSTSI